jgi:hypothetical protein
MRVIAPTHFGVNDHEFESLEKCAENMLDGDSYDNGVMEATAERARNNSRAIGRLLDWLADTKQITAEVVSAILADPCGGSVKFAGPVPAPAPDIRDVSVFRRPAPKKCCSDFVEIPWIAPGDLTEAENRASLVAAAAEWGSEPVRLMRA